MTKKNWIYISFFTALVIAFYFVLTALIPDMAKKVPPISYIRPFSFTSQYGTPFTEKDVAGKVFVAEYFFTTCKSICPLMNTNMRKVYDEFKDEKSFLILSHTSTPDIDSVPVLKKYADSIMGVSSPNWIFLTGRKDSLYHMARVSYVIDDPNNNVVNIEDDFLHTQFWALVDKNGDVRKIYDGLKQSEVQLLISDIKKLLKE